MVIGIACAVFASLSEVAAADNAMSKSQFRAKCSTCHGPDGAGSPFGDALSNAEIHSQVVYIRRFRTT